MAAGLSLAAENLSTLRRELSRAVESQLEAAARPEAELVIDEFLNLDELSLDLAAQIEKLAPFGAGNPPLILATRNLELANSQTIGKTQEHVKLTVRDEAGSVASVLWWGSADLDLPSGRFDLAYTLRANDYKGQPQLSLELVDFRVVEDAVVEVEGPRVEVIDLRLSTDRGANAQMGASADGGTDARMRPSADRITDARIVDLEQILETYPNALIFAEGDDRKRLKAKGRHELSAAEMLVLWSTPPERGVYESILETVKPRRLVLFAQDPGEDSAEAFLARLAGLLKFVLNQRGGQVSFDELGAACGQGEAAIRAGFEYLKASGQVSGACDAEGIRLQEGKAPTDESARAEWMSQLSYLLHESRAYRAYFRGMKV
jgi:single-stranded-DNA-specific exonuclease